MPLNSVDSTLVSAVERRSGSKNAINFECIDELELGACKLFDIAQNTAPQNIIFQFDNNEIVKAEITVRMAMKFLEECENKKPVLVLTHSKSMLDLIVKQRNFLANSLGYDMTQCVNSCSSNCDKRCTLPCRILICCSGNLTLDTLMEMCSNQNLMKSIGLLILESFDALSALINADEMIYSLENFSKETHVVIFAKSEEEASAIKAVDRLNSSLVVEIGKCYKYLEKDNLKMCLFHPKVENNSVLNCKINAVNFLLHRIIFTRCLVFVDKACQNEIDALEARLKWWYWSAQKIGEKDVCKGTGHSVIKDSSRILIITGLAENQLNVGSFNLVILFHIPKKCAEYHNLLQNLSNQSEYCAVIFLIMNHNDKEHLKTLTRKDGVHYTLLKGNYSTLLINRSENCEKRQSTASSYESSEKNWSKVFENSVEVSEKRICRSDLSRKGYEEIVAPYNLERHNIDLNRLIYLKKCIKPREIPTAGNSVKYDRSAMLNILQAMFRGGEKLSGNIQISTSNNKVAENESTVQKNAEEVEMKKKKNSSISKQGRKKNKPNAQEEEQRFVVDPCLEDADEAVGDDDEGEQFDFASGGLGYENESEAFRQVMMNVNNYANMLTLMHHYIESMVRPRHRKGIKKN
ncbi:hypothetical protein T4C_7031 [Trichinella pseudospiralis]|uniref:Uncharacterized protein n=1 Tax=Trichinella pseudospiralis TaxID=6337 RepID=A0A0V1J506_TRIPS|nr:hypothetical protein T4C_7031 [Trichinella pseudospiralis]